MRVVIVEELFGLGLTHTIRLRQRLTLRSARITYVCTWLHKAADRKGI
jgi:hypothetical protein